MSVKKFEEGKRYKLNSPYYSYGKVLRVYPNGILDIRVQPIKGSGRKATTIVGYVVVML